MEWDYKDGLPLVPIEIINPLTKAASKHYALVDSGSDWCSLPKELWEELGFEEIGKLELGTPMGWIEAGFSWCNIKLAGKSVPVEFHYTFGPEVLVGRNAMRHFVITFDGKQEKLVVK